MAYVPIVLALLALSCSSSIPRPKPADAGRAASAGVVTARLGCFSYQTGVALGQVPRDAKADADCSVFDRAGEGSAGAAP